MSNRIVFSGLEELKAALRALPDSLTAEASRIVEGAANAMAADVKREYPVGPTGNLAGSVYVTHFDKGRFQAGAIVKNAAKHAYIFENGTEARHYYTKGGAIHPTGKMPPGHVFIPIAIRRRRWMWQQLAEMVKRNGFQVTGTP